ncbi:tRNA lysidine(34) synthetase TilS [Sporosarcina sp. P37]|uniref:tRNA lysidine(34) synthetase TilS n=1 Tax=unclassified Sporosarcina TaxID=2647733 RepID=UPI000A17F847|nr:MULTISPECIES: tRNA lysidine(34) synthetase TilS [unclassified Sporosarcina]ARK24974.1 tRNA lysidine(34) synthetase TilS [Sporosarcina sp. P37]PID18114.1 tRNA(Ile)-lysidine synthetase [Sporosarcina sp. P35]
MKSLQQKVLKFIEKQTLIPPGSRVLVACSGGVDSIALLHFLAAHRQLLAIEVGAIHVDHMLRGAESAEDAFVVERLCEEFGLPFYSEQVPIPALLKNQGGNMQQLCRQQRYACFEQTMSRDQFTVLATAHHADDQLETVLIQLSKGQSVNGMPIRREFHSGEVVRPFLPLEKRELYEYASHYRLSFREDPSNERDDYLRNRLRHRVVPVLSDENPSVAVNTVRQTEQRQADERFLNELAGQHWQSIVTYTDEQLPSFQREAFLTIPHALQKRVIQLLLNCLTDRMAVNAERRSALVEELLQHIENSAGNVTIDLAYGYRFVREYDKLLVTKKDIDTASLHPKVLEKGIWHTWGSIHFYWHHANAHATGHFLPSDEIRYFQLPDSELPLTVRLPAAGDRLQLKGMSQPKRVNRLFIDEKVGIMQRNQQPVITTAGGTVCAVPGVRYGEMFSRSQLEGDSYIWITREGESR